MTLKNKPTYETPEGYGNLIANHDEEQYWAEFGLDEDPSKYWFAKQFPS